MGQEGGSEPLYWIIVELCRCGGCRSTGLRDGHERPNHLKAMPVYCRRNFHRLCLLDGGDIWSSHGHAGQLI